MAHILFVLPQTEFDPTEVAVPWKAWSDAVRKVSFATETGAAVVWRSGNIEGGRIALPCTLHGGAPRKPGII